MQSISFYDRLYTIFVYNTPQTVITGRPQKQSCLDLCEACARGGWTTRVQNHTIEEFFPFVDLDTPERVRGCL